MPERRHAARLKLGDLELKVESYDLISECRARANQNASVFREGRTVGFKTKQTTSTPGLIFGELTLPAGAYKYIVTACASAENNAFLWTLANGKRLCPDTHLSTEVSDTTVCFNLTEEKAVSFGVLAHNVKGELSVEISAAEVELLNSDAASTEISDSDVDTSLSDAPSQQPHARTLLEETSGIFGIGQKYLVGVSSAHGQKAFERYAVEIYQFIVISLAEARRLLKQGTPVLVSGYKTDHRKLAREFPDLVHVVWHSTFEGSFLMAESGKLYDLLQDTKGGIAHGLLLSDFDQLPVGWKRINQFIPRDLQKPDVAFETRPSRVVLPLGGTTSQPLKLTHKLLIDCMCANLDFSVTPNLAANFPLDFLKESFSSTSDYHIFEGSHSPIDESYYQSGRVYVCASATDTMPYTVLESLSAGTPVVVSPNVGWAAVFSEFSHLCVAQPSCAISLAEHLLREPAILSRLLSRQIAAVNRKSKVWFRNNSNLFSGSAPRSISELVAICRGLTETFNDGERVHIRLQGPEEEFFRDAAVVSKKCGFSFESGVISKSISTSRKARLEVELRFKRSNDPSDESSSPQSLRDLNESNCFVEEAESWNKGLKHLLVVDTYDWAFANIAEQISQRSSSPEEWLILSESDTRTLLRLNKLRRKHWKNIVYFWFPRLLEFEEALSSEKTHISIFDHYSPSTHRDLLQKALRKTDTVFVGNLEIADSIAETYPDAEIVVAKDGVDFERFPLLESQHSASLTLGWIGHAAKPVHGERYDCKGFALLKEVECFLQQSDLNISILAHETSEKGKIPHAEVSKRFYSKVDVVLCLSESEGTPNPVFEALASGKRVLTTRVGNTADIVVDGFNGLFVERSCDSVVNAAKLLQQKVPNPHAIREHAKSFDWKFRALPWLNVLESAT